MVMSRLAVKDFLGRDFDSFTWMKRLQRDDILRELVQVKVLPQFKTDPWIHQLVCFYIAIHYPRFLFLLDMGLGKTKIMLDAMTQLQREKRMKRALVFIPRKGNIDSWLDGIATHSDLEPWPINQEDIEEKWERLSNPKGDLSLIDYQGFQLATSKKVAKTKGGGNRYVKDEKKIKLLSRAYNLTVLDESHMLSGHDNLWFSVLRQFTKELDFCYAMTGTLFGKDPISIWSQFYLVDRGETFGSTLGLFREAFYEPDMDSWNASKLKPKQGSSRVIHKMLQHRSIRYDEEEVQELPPTVPRIEKLHMTSEQRDHFLRALDGFIDAGGQVDKLDGAWVRMRQIVSGYLKWSDEYGEHELFFKENPKLDRLEGLIAAMGDSKIIVCYEYTPTGAMICKRLKELGIDHEWYYGGTKDQSASRRRFITDPSCRVFVMNSATGGTGVDGLQDVARYMTFFETPSSPIVRKQTSKRIRRPGQKRRTFIYDLVMLNSLDQGILNSVQAGIDLHSQVVAGKLKPEFLLSL
jgi:SNF2 family DNA or RNA helicase